MMILMIELDSAFPDARIVKMFKMKPGQVGMVSEHGCYNGHTVMRTLASNKFEVMDLSDPRTDRCWISNPDIKVRLLRKDEAVYIKIVNDE